MNKKHVSGLEPERRRRRRRSQRTMNRNGVNLQFSNSSPPDHKHRGRGACYYVYAQYVCEFTIGTRGNSGNAGKSRPVGRSGGQRTRVTHQGFRRVILQIRKYLQYILRICTKYTEYTHSRVHNSLTAGRCCSKGRHPECIPLYCTVLVLVHAPRTVGRAPYGESVCRAVGLARNRQYVST